MLSVCSFDGAYIAQHVADLSLPTELRDLCDFVDVLDVLYSWKHHHLKLEKIVEPAQCRQKRSETLVKFRAVHTTV
jgi:hypothetical protein